MPPHNLRYAALVFAGTLLVGLALNACTTLNKDECLHADWFSIGYEDGARGYKTSRIGQHRQACARHGVAPDFETYEKGRRQGLAEWCTPRNGYVMGAAGRRYNGVCPNDLEPDYLEAFNQGKAVYAYQKQIRVQRLAVEKMHTDLDALDKDIDAMETERSGQGVSPRRRKALAAEIRGRKEDRRLLLDQISDAEHTVDAMQHNLLRMKAQNPYQ
jgi:hypothetical protein